MNHPVDLANLRSMTDGDAEMEKALFEEFFSSFEAGIATLQANMSAAASETWRKNAHSLKGISLNLGATELGELCRLAQNSEQATEAEKAELLQKIALAYQQVKLFLQGIA